MKFATCVQDNEQRVALSMFEYVRTYFTLALTTVNVAFASTTVFPLKSYVSFVIIPLACLHTKCIPRQLTFDAFHGSCFETGNRQN